jgi:hypothetical protein
MEHKETATRSWAEKHGGTIFGGGVIVLLAALIAFMTVCGNT